MAIMKIITTPHPVLIGKAKEVKKFDTKLKSLAKDMEETLLATTDPVGVGLAAPQVGVSLQIFQMKPTDKAKVVTYVNPKILSFSADEKIPNFKGRNENVNKPEKSKNKLLEGCLSIPNIWGNVTRKKDVTLSWQDLKGNSFNQVFTGFPAVIIQHEMDHLNGILFTKHVVEQGEQLYKSHKDENNEDVFDEINL